MPVLKFWTKNGLVLDNLVIEDITEISKIAMKDIANVLEDIVKNPLYQIDNSDSYVVVNDLAFNLLNLFRGGKRDALLYTKDNFRIIVVPSKSYVFWNGKSIDPIKYEFTKTETQLRTEYKV